MKRKQAAATCHQLDEFLPPKRSATLSSSCSKGASLQLPVPSSRESATCCSEEAPSLQPGPSSCESSVNSEKPLATATASSASDQVLPESVELVAVTQMQGSSSADVVDIGDIYKRSESPTDLCVAIKSLSSFQKYNLLINHKKPHKYQQFPTTYIGGCNRSFRQVWLDERPWMV